MRPSFPAILAVVESMTATDRAELCGSSREPRVVLARGIVCIAAHEFGGMSYPEIAAGMGEYRETGLRPAHTTPLTSAHRSREVLLAAEAMLMRELAAGGVA